jgi:hypothetical protein
MHTHNTFTAVAQALNCPLWMYLKFYENQKENPKYLEER